MFTRLIVGYLTSENRKHKNDLTIFFVGKFIQALSKT